MRDEMTQLGHHFADVACTYRHLRDLDLGAVRLIGDVLARSTSRARAVRLLDIGTGSGRYRDAVAAHVSTKLGRRVDAIGLDVSPAMVAQGGRPPPPAAAGGVRTTRMVGVAEHLPFTGSACDAVTCFNAIHHFNLIRFMDEAARVLTSHGHLVLYTRTPGQNRRTIWGRYFPKFATRETRLSSVDDLRTAVRATHAFATVHAQTISWRVTTSLARLLEQVTSYHYSTFRLYPPDAFRAAVDIFQRRLERTFTDVTNITWDNDHMLVVAERRAWPRVTVPAPRRWHALQPIPPLDEVTTAGSGLHIRQTQDRRPSGADW